MKLLPENIEYIIIHSSRTRNPKPHQGVRLLDKVHRMRRAFSWNLGGHDCYHHFVIRTDGVVEEARPLDVPGNHTLGFNEKSISVCYMGGVDRRGFPVDTRTDAQKEAMRELLDRLQEQFPKAVAVLHSQLAPRRSGGCPGFSLEQL